MTPSIQTTALTAPVDRKEYRAFQSTLGHPKRPLWPKVLGVLGTCALSVVLSLYVTEGELALVPWFAIAIALLFFVSWLLVRRASRRRRVLRYRLDLLARENGLTLEHDVPNPTTPGLLFTIGTKPVTVVRLSPRGNLDTLQIGIHARTEPTPAGNTAVVETLYVIAAHPPGETDRPADAPQTSAVGPDSPPFAADGPPPRPVGLDSLPRASVGSGEDATAFRYDELGDRTACYIDELLDLTDPRTWNRLSAVRDWIAGRRTM
jgi:hypothetical protein